MLGELKALMAKHPQPWFLYPNYFDPGGVIVLDCADGDHVAAFRNIEKARLALAAVNALPALVAVAEKARDAVKPLALVVETIYMTDSEKPYAEFSPQLRAALAPAVAALRAMTAALSALPGAGEGGARE